MAEDGAEKLRIDTEHQAQLKSSQRLIDQTKSMISQLKRDIEYQEKILAR
jgi:hypothetical protein